MSGTVADEATAPPNSPCAFAFFPVSLVATKNRSIGGVREIVLATPLVELASLGPPTFSLPR
jgi:hypothetical protein